MMDYGYLGKIVTTHGIKGEVKILSDFLKKDLVFKKDFKLYIGEEKEVQIINTYRVHQKYDMVTFKEIKDINEVLKYKNQNVYFNKNDLQLKKDEFLIEDLIGLKIKQDKYYGFVQDIYKTKGGILLYISYDKPYYIPYVADFIKKIDWNAKEIMVERVEELL